MTGQAPTFVVLARHGEAAMPDAAGAYGRTDAPLTDRGRAQARELAGRLAEVDLTTVYTSPLPRAVETAQIVAAPFGIQPVRVPELREVELGRFEGITQAQVRADFPEFVPWLEIAFFARFPTDDCHHPARLRFPGGESVHTMMRRLRPAFRDIVRRESGRAVVLVTHAWVTKALLCHVVGAPAAAYYRLGDRNASLTLAEVDASGRGVLHMHNTGAALGEIAGGRLPLR